MANGAFKYYAEKTLGWMLNNKVIVLLSLLSFCLFVSTLALAGQKNRAEASLLECQNSSPSNPETPVNDGGSEDNAAADTEGGSQDNGAADNEGGSQDEGTADGGDSQDSGTADGGDSQDSGTVNEPGTSDQDGNSNADQTPNQSNQGDSQAVNSNEGNSDAENTGPENSVPPSIIARRRRYVREIVQN